MRDGFRGKLKVTLPVIAPSQAHSLVAETHRLGMTSENMNTFVTSEYLSKEAGCETGCKM